MPGRDCVLFVTHRWSDSVAAHYERLKRQAGGLLDVLLVYQARNSAAVPGEAKPDIVVTTDEIAAAFPRRFGEYGDGWTFHCADLVWMTAAGKTSASAYERVWALEYDVDFSGDWSTFFTKAVHYEGDLLGTDLRYLRDTPNWPNAGGYQQPGYGPEDPLIGFFPAVRASRALIDAYRRDLEAEGWTGHFEMVLPSFAMARGFTVSEIGGDTAFTPRERRGLHYTTPRVVGRPTATFLFRPPRSFRYFGESPPSFPNPDLLYHPIKSDLSFRERCSFTWQRFGHRWVAFRNRMLGRG